MKSVNSTLSIPLCTSDVKSLHNRIDSTCKVKRIKSGFRTSNICLFDGRFLSQERDILNEIHRGVPCSYRALVHISMLLVTRDQQVTRPDPELVGLKRGRIVAEYFGTAWDRIHSPRWCTVFNKLKECLLFDLSVKGKDIPLTGHGGP
jgi:hypothetical protein